MIEPLILKEEIESAILRIADSISKDYNESSLYVLSVLKGSFIFTADLLRKISVPVEVDFIQASSYKNSKVSSGNVLLDGKSLEHIKGKNILVLEDIVDTGHTLGKLYRHLESFSPASIKVCALLFKQRKYKYTIPIDYVGFVIEDHFVIGYGMDFAEKYRNLDYIACVSQS